MKRREFLRSGSKIAAFGAFAGSFAGVASGFTNMLFADSKSIESSNISAQKVTDSRQNIKLASNDSNIESKQDFSANVPFLKLNNGISMPLVGLGTYDLRDNACVQAMQDALSVGYRLFDTAQMYENESEVGKGLNAGLKSLQIPRERIFVTTKLSNNMSYNECKNEIETRLKKLNLGYIDLLLLHREFESRNDMWRAMEEAHKAGKIRALGISNFSKEVFLEFIKTCEIKPVLNQLETHVFFQRNEYQKILESHGVKLQAWSPFSKGRNDFFTNKTLESIAKKHNKSVAQIGLNYLASRGVSVIPKTSKIERMKENINIFDFKLDSKDLAAISKLDTNKSSFGWFNG